MAEFKSSIARNILLAAVIFSVVLGATVYANVVQLPVNSIHSSSQSVTVTATYLCAAPPNTIQWSGKPISGLTNFSQQQVQAFEIPIPCTATIAVAYTAPQVNAFNLYNMSMPLDAYRVSGNTQGEYQCNYSATSTIVSTSSNAGPELEVPLAPCPGISLDITPASVHFLSSSENVTVDFTFSVSTNAIQGLYFLWLPNNQCVRIPIVIGNPAIVQYPSMIYGSCGQSSQFPTASVDSFVNFNRVNVAVEQIQNATSVSLSSSQITTTTTTVTVTKNVTVTP